MAGETLFQLSISQKKDAEANLEKLGKIIKNKVALVDSGMFTKEQIAQIESTYDMTKKMLETFEKTT